MFNFLTTYKVPLEGGLKIQRTERLVGASREAIKRMLQENIGECVEVISCYKTSRAVVAR